MTVRAGAAIASALAMTWAVHSAPIHSASIHSTPSQSKPAVDDLARCAALADEPARQARFEAASTILPGAYPGELPVTLPAHCRVEGVLQPATGSRVGYVLLLPPHLSWNGRFQMLGNGGYSSRLPMAAMAGALVRGSAALATDTGHQGDDPDFALGHPEAIIDWGWRAVHVSALAGKDLLTRFYGQAARHSYFAGCSTGGHQAMMEAQRFPADFDGIIAGAPGSDRVRLNAAFLWQFLANHPDGADSKPVLSPTDLDLLQANARAQCRPANGGSAGGLASDPWIDDPLTCKPDIQRLACLPGQEPGKPQSCLTPAKITVAQALYRGARDSRTNAQLTWPWLPGSESGWRHYWADPAEPGQPMRINFWRVWAFRNPSWSWHGFDFTRDLPAIQARLSPEIDAPGRDLSAFRARGGRLLQYHGLDDPVVSPLDTLAKRKAMLAHMGEGTSWYRLFLVPGMQHCAGGEGFIRFDMQDAIERWVEHGQAPERIEARDTANRSRPLCAYPAHAVLTGKNANEASSFRCSR